MIRMNSTEPWPGRCACARVVQRLPCHDLSISDLMDDVSEWTCQPSSVAPFTPSDLSEDAADILDDLDGDLLSRDSAR